MAAQQAVHFIGMPEGALALAELVVYLAAAPKSNAVYRRTARRRATRWRRARSRCRSGSATRPTPLMKQLGYGKGYRYAHDEEEGVAAMDCLPDALAGRRYYQPTARGAEADLAARLEAGPADPQQEEVTGRPSSEDSSEQVGHDRPRTDVVGCRARGLTCSSASVGGRGTEVPGERKRNVEGRAMEWPKERKRPPATEIGGWDGKRAAHPPLT